MTRETKIGLLVGLAFIIIVGILLTEPMSHSNELPQAQLTDVTHSVRSGNGLPATTSPPVVTPAPTVRLESPVPTAQETHAAQGVAVIHIGAADSGTHHPLVVDSGAGQVRGSSANTARELPPVTHVDDVHNGAADGGAGPGAGGAMARDPRVAVAAGLGEAVVGADMHGRTLADTPEGMRRRETPPTPGAAGATNGAMKPYEAVAGDTLSKLAGRLLGANTKANRQAIIDANPSLKDAPDKIIAGQTYKIPVAPNPAAPAAPVPAPAAGGSTPAVATSGHAAPAEPRPAAPEHFYVVQAGDNLTRIAVAQLGDARAVAAIKELNKELLKGGDMVMPEMKLRLPAAPVN